MPLCNQTPGASCAVGNNGSIRNTWNPTTEVNLSWTNIVSTNGSCRCIEGVECVEDTSPLVLNTLSVTIRAGQNFYYGIVDDSALVVDAVGINLGSDYTHSAIALVTACADQATTYRAVYRHATTPYTVGDAPHGQSGAGVQTYVYSDPCVGDCTV